MGKDYILASDLGGSGTKTMLFDLDGTIVVTAFRESKLYHDEKDATTQNPEEMFMSTVEGIKECMEKSGIAPNEVRALVLDGQQAGLMWIDDNYQAISPYDSWLDNRFGPFIKVMDQYCGQTILDSCGTRQNIKHGPKILWWKANHPEIFKKACKMVLPSTYIGGRLAGLQGEEGYFEDTSLGFSGIADIEKDEWNREICYAVGIPIEKMPRIVKPTEIIGKLTKEMAELLGLPSGIPIVAGAGDFPAAGVGAGICSQGQTGDIAGTASIFFAGVEKWKPDSEGVLSTLRSPFPGLWYQFALFSGGGCLRWFRDTFFAKEKEEKNVYQCLDNLSKDLPLGDDGLIFYPYIGGRFQPSEPDYSGAWFGIQWGHRREHFYRAILESIAFEYKNYLSCIKKLLGLDNFNETRVFGGGSASPVFNQIKSDVLGLPYLTLKQQECSLLGSAIIAGCAIGFYQDMVEASQKVNQIAARRGKN
jgi:xylulokinase